MRVFAGLLSASLLCVAQAIFWGPNPEWNNLKVTFGTNIFRSGVFDALPRTEAAARSDGWTKIAECDESSNFRGRRYVKNNDHAVILLFDVNGYIAGIQCGLLRAQVPAWFLESQILRNALQDDGLYLTLTAYFVDPTVICTTGRNAAMFAEEGTGSNLYIQNGNDPLTQSLRVPREEKEVKGTIWTQGRCFYAMGNHYWYNTSADMSCEDFFPAFLMYNGGKLNAFGWALGLSQSSPRFEHPTASVLSYFFKDVPKCLKDIPQLSTMHIYLTSYPLTNVCIAR